ncbi:MAG TPA: zf-HC2 domain-containing protein [Streptosporangiaceae bacterium]|jgi:anti-sigma factor RsiW
MSHLGRRLSALIDGELSDTERDQVYAHLVSCEDCRADASALRTIKRRVGGLGETPADGTLTSRLIALAALGEPPPPRPRFLAAPRTRVSMTAFPGGDITSRPPAWNDVPEWYGSEPAGADDEITPAASSAGRGRPHARYVVAGAVAALAVSLGAASFAAGGEQSSGPRVTPEVDMFSFEHAVNTGELPLVMSREFSFAKQAGVPARP